MSKKILASSIFRLRLCSRKELLEKLFACYHRLDDELKGELPLKHFELLQNLTNRARRASHALSSGAAWPCRLAVLPGLPDRFSARKVEQR